MAVAWTWQVADVETADDGTFVVTTQSLGGGAPHTINFSPDAIGVRMALYGLTSPTDAFEAILREAAVIVSASIKTPPPPSTKAHLGGQRSDLVAIVYTSAAVSNRDAALTAHADRIGAASADRWDQPRYVAMRAGTV